MLLRISLISRRAGAERLGLLGLHDLATAPVAIGPLWPWRGNQAPILTTSGLLYTYYLLFFEVLAGGYPQQGAVGHLMAQEPQRTTKRESKLLGISTATDRSYCSVSGPLIRLPRLTPTLPPHAQHVLLTA